jgi:hypothetical protein
VGEEARNCQLRLDLEQFPYNLRRPIPLPELDKRTREHAEGHRERRLWASALSAHVTALGPEPE